MMDDEVQRRVKQAQAKKPEQKPVKKTKVKKDTKKMTGMEYMQHINRQGKGFI